MTTSKTDKTADPNLFEARATVLSAMGNHKQALQIYVFDIRSPEKAETYCNQIYLSSNTAQTPSAFSPLASPSLSGFNKRLAPMTTEKVTTMEKAFIPYDSEDQPPNIYTILLGLYLRPPPPHDMEVLWEPALDLLSKHGARLPASSTLDLMPDDLLVLELEKYFRGRIRSANSVRNEERIVKGLEAVRKGELERDLLLGNGGKTKGRNRRVVIREDDHCKICHKRFGNSAVRVYPDNEVLHYGCIGRSGTKRMTGLGGLAAQSGDFEGMRKVPWA